MGRQIVRQPNGKYLVYSSICDNVVLYDATPQEIIDCFAEEEKEKITSSINSIIEKLEKGEKPYYQFTMNFEEVIENIKLIHGKKESDKVLNFITK
jgi:formylmethanofuran dehydrogenase subunit A